MSPHKYKDMRENPIGVFDSGVGGLNVLRKCAELMPNEKFIYLADEARMPYGTKPAVEIRLAALHSAELLFAMNCKALVVACNTATATAIDDIRAMYSARPVIGLEPAVKPCYRELGKNGYAVAIVTAATYGSAKFGRLMETCDGKIIPLAVPELAKLIEDNTRDIRAIAPYVREMLAPYKNAEAVILGCSHYTYITGLIRDAYGGNIKIYDGAAGAAERLRYCLAISDMTAPSNARGGVRFYSTFRRAE